MYPYAWTENGKLVVDDWGRIVSGRNPRLANRLAITLSWPGEPDETKRFVTKAHYVNGRTYLVYRRLRANRYGAYHIGDWPPFYPDPAGLIEAEHTGGSFGWNQRRSYSLRLKFAEDNAELYIQKISTFPFAQGEVTDQTEVNKDIDPSTAEIGTSINIASWSVYPAVRFIRDAGGSLRLAFPPDFTVTTTAGVTIDIRKIGVWRDLDRDLNPGETVYSTTY